MIFSHQHHHWAYVWIPLFGSFIWFGMLLSMLVTWLAQGRYHYPSMDGKIAYISDIGAAFLKPLFVTGCCITAVCFFLSTLIERYLRHSGRLMPNMRKRERVFGSLSVLFAFIGGCGIVLLSIFDTVHHTTLHRLFLLIFIVGVGLSAIFTVIEFRWISNDFRDVKTLRRGYWAKGIIATILILCAIAFAATLYYVADVGAVLEWTISFGFTLYMLTYYFDLRMSKGVHKGELSAENILSGDLGGMRERERQGIQEH